MLLNKIAGVVVVVAVNGIECCLTLMDLKGYSEVEGHGVPPLVSRLKYCLISSKDCKWIDESKLNREKKKRILNKNTRNSIMRQTHIQTIRRTNRGGNMKEQNI